MRNPSKAPVCTQVRKTCSLQARVMGLSTPRRPAQDRVPARLTASYAPVQPCTSSSTAMQQGRVPGTRNREHRGVTALPSGSDEHAAVSVQTTESSRVWGSRDLRNDATGCRHAAQALIRGKALATTAICTHGPLQHVQAGGRLPADDPSRILLYREMAACGSMTGRFPRFLSPASRILRSMCAQHLPTAKNVIKRDCRMQDQRTGIQAELPKCGRGTAVTCGRPHCPVQRPSEKTRRLP